MDIVKYAEEMNWAVDYYDYHTGRIYAITEGRDLYDKKKIPVYENSIKIGFVNVQK